LSATISIFGCKRYIPRKIFTAIKPVKTVFLWTQDLSDDYSRKSTCGMFLHPWGLCNVDALKYYVYALRDGTIIYADKAYDDYENEDLLNEVDHIQLLPIRRRTRKELCPPLSFVRSYYRKRVETAGSLIEQLLSKSIHAITSQGIELKVALFVIASSLNCYLDL
jgi:hypothetical protein